jgi:hypothetical protein
LALTFRQHLNFAQTRTNRKRHEHRTPNDRITANHQKQKPNAPDNRQQPPSASPNKQHAQVVAPKQRRPTPNAQAAPNNAQGTAPPAASWLAGHQHWRYLRRDFHFLSALHISKQQAIKN